MYDKNNIRCQYASMPLRLSGVLRSCAGGTLFSLKKYIVSNDKNFYKS